MKSATVSKYIYYAILNEILIGIKCALMLAQIQFDCDISQLQVANLNLHKMYTVLNIEC